MDYPDEPTGNARRTFPELWWLNSWQKYALVGVTVYGGLVLLGWAWPKKTVGAPKQRAPKVGCVFCRLHALRCLHSALHALLTRAPPSDASGARLKDKRRHSSHLWLARCSSHSCVAAEQAHRVARLIGC